LNRLVLVFFLALLLFAESDLPDYGDPEAPASLYISSTYIEDSLEDTQTPNIVTAVLADYRGYDTLGETVVIFTAGLAVALILSLSNGGDSRPLFRPYGNPVVDSIARLIAPPILVFALYVIAHGHYGPGGGFQGGAILTGFTILLRLSLGEAYEHLRFSPQVMTALGSIGLLVFLSVGLLSLPTESEFLDYGGLPFPGISSSGLHYLAILVVEFGIGLAVWGTLVALFDRLMGRQA